MDPSSSRAAHQFAGFILDLVRGVLLSDDGQEVSLRPKSFALLRLFVENPQRLLSRDEIMRAIWPDVIVADDGIDQCVRDIRLALGDREQRVLRTVRRRGYILAVSVEVVPRIVQAEPFINSALAALPSFDSRTYLSVVGYSNMTGRDKVDTPERLRGLHIKAIDPSIKKHGGRILRVRGDSLLSVFDRVDEAVYCAVEIQRRYSFRCSNHMSDKAIRFYIGINTFDEIADGAVLHDDEAVVASGLGAECPPGNIYVSLAVRDHLRDQREFVFEELYRQRHENADQPMQVFLLRLDTSVRKTEPIATSMQDLGIATAPPLSLVVLPFDILGGDAREQGLAAFITEGLTTDLLRLPGTVVVSPLTAAHGTGSAAMKSVGEELRVRYVIQGGIHLLTNVLRANIRLTSAETNLHIWAGTFEQDMSDPGAGQEELVSRLKASLGLQLFRTEIERSKRDRPSTMDDFDLMLHAWMSVLYRPFSSELYRETGVLYERVLQSEPSSTGALCGLAGVLTDRYIVYGTPDRGDEKLIERAASLVSAALAIDPNGERPIFRLGGVLRAQGRWSEALATFGRLLELYPTSDVTYRQLGYCKLAVGESEAAIPLLQRSIRLDPLSPWNRDAFQRIGQSLLVLGNAADSIDWLQRALAASHGAPASWHAQCYLLLCSAHAVLGHANDADRALTEANQLWPFATVRNTPPTMSPRGLPSAAYAAQMQCLREGMRIAGLRDHAEEDTDWNLISDNALHLDLVGHTPANVPGATTIRTDELANMLSRQTPLLIDVALDSWGRSIPGAIGLQGAGHGADFSTGVQNRFSRKMHDITNGDLSTPIVTYCANCERFTGYNLALRLGALGYKRVYWYRGGFESWQVNGLPESDLRLQDW